MPFLYSCPKRIKKSFYFIKSEKTDNIARLIFYFDREEIALKK